MCENAGEERATWDGTPGIEELLSRLLGRLWGQDQHTSRRVKLGQTCAVLLARALLSLEQPWGRRIGGWRGREWVLGFGVQGTI